MSSIRGLTKIQRLRSIEKNSIFVNGLSWITGPSELRQYFDSFGKVVSTFMFMDNYRGMSRGHAVVQFENKEALDLVFKQSHHYIDGNEMKINVNKGRNSDSNSQQTSIDHADT